MAERDWHGVRRLYLRGNEEAETLRALVEESFLFDKLGVEAAWGLAQGPLRTAVSGISQAACAPAPALEIPLRDAFLSALTPADALALGGGLDAALVLAGLRESGLPLPALLTLATGLPGYDEVERASAIAAHFSAPLQVVQVNPETLVELLPQAIACIETPLYNLHPVSRLALSIEARARGYESLLTGDGADAACAGKPDLDYVPLVAALSAGLRLSSPFFSPQVIAGSRGPAKSKLRELATQLGLPDWIAQSPKRSRLMPELDVSRFGTCLAPELGEPRPGVRWATLGLLARHLGRT
ncbi:MAG TPA: asparagine synthase-related protein [Myxococcales bacterium]|nr:asparagine synthase-related protein [Myxococcales bacterium]